jgi:hypothetical protein
MKLEAPTVKIVTSAQQKMRFVIAKIGFRLPLLVRSPGSR